MDIVQSALLRGVDLKAERVRRGLTQAHVGARLGVSARRIANVEGAYRPAPSFVVRYIAALGRSEPAA